MEGLCLGTLEFICEDGEPSSADWCLGVLTSHPQQVPGYVALALVEPGPPPLGLHVVAAPQHRQSVALTEGELVGVLGRVVPESPDQTLVHHPQLLLDA